jgi:hypothetical protein
MFKRCSIPFQVFYSIFGVTVSIAATIQSFSSSKVTGVVKNFQMKSSGESSGELGGHGIGPSRPNPAPRKMHVKKFPDNTSLVRRCTILLKHHIWLIIFKLGQQTQLLHVQVGNRCHCLFRKEKGPKTSEHAKAHQTLIRLSTISFNFSNSVRVF